MKTAVILAVFLAAGGTCLADGIPRWKAPDGSLYFGDTPPPGSERMGTVEADPSSPEPPTADESGNEDRFSIEISLERRRLGKEATAAARALARVREEIVEVENERLELGVGPIEDSIDVQEAVASAAAVAREFERGRLERLRELEKEERAILRDVRAAYRQMDELGARLREEYGGTPSWWRETLDCATCPTRAEVEAALQEDDERPPDSSFGR